MPAFRPGQFSSPRGPMSPLTSALLGKLKNLKDFYSNQRPFREANGLPPYGAPVIPGDGLTDGSGTLMEDGAGQTLTQT